MSHNTLSMTERTVELANSWFNNYGAPSDFESRRKAVNLISVASDRDTDAFALKDGLEALLAVARYTEKNRLSLPLLSKRKYRKYYAMVTTRPSGTIWAQHLNGVRKQIMQEFARLGR